MKRIRWRWSPSSIPEVAQRQWRALYETLTGPVGATVHLLEPEKDMPDIVFQQSPLRRFWEINFPRDLERAVKVPLTKPPPHPSAGDRR